MTLAKEIHCEHIVEQTLLLVRELFGLENHALNQLITAPPPRALQLANISKAFVESDYEFTSQLGIYTKKFFSSPR